MTDSKSMHLFNSILIKNRLLKRIKSKKSRDIGLVVARVKYFVENLDKLVAKKIDPVKKAQLFGVIFDRLPTYEEIKPGTPKTPLFTRVNPLFQAIASDNFPLVNLTTKQVEILLESVEGLDNKLKVLIDT